MTRFTRSLRPFQQFASTESAGGVVLLSAAALALAWANSPWAATYFNLWNRPISISVDSWVLSKSIHHWINDGLMVVFFFLVGLEIKRELLVGELASARQAALPVAAAVGGMVLPAALYAIANVGGGSLRGWAIPMATDIAFALGVLSLLGSRVSTSLKVFLTALAIVDDVGAVLVIAFFYTTSLSLIAVAAAGILLLVLDACNRHGVRRTTVYIGLGVALWAAVLSSGIHPTIAGILLALTIPARTRIDEDQFIDRAEAALAEFDEASGPHKTVLANSRQQEALHAMEGAVADAQAPLLRMEHALHRVVAFGIMPLFALANAGVSLRGDALGNLNWRIAGGIIIGLMIGKSLGITGAAWLAVRTGAAIPLSRTRWLSLYGVGWLGGIGFTMSLFIADLAFRDGTTLASAKVGILGGSLIAGTVGWLILRFSTSERSDKTDPLIPFPDGDPIDCIPSRDPEGAKLENTRMIET
jgi:NhaA family Na+:H+ antiporter